MFGLFKYKPLGHAKINLMKYEAHRLDNETARVYARKYILGFLFVLVVCGVITFISINKEGSYVDTGIKSAYYYHNVDVITLE